MDGVELFERLAATPALASTTKVLLSTGRPLVAATVHRPGISASVAKPVVNTELHAPARLMSAVELAPGAGAAALSPAEWSRRPAPASGPGARGRVLVVEDNTTNQMLAMGLLARLGFDAEVVSNGQQAVEAVARTDYDTVLMDCHMPVMDGFEATAAIRHLGRDGKASGRPTRHVPIVAMTAGALVGNRERCLAAGMDDYVSKPVKLADLDSVLAAAARATRPSTPSTTTQPTRVDAVHTADVIDEDQLASLRALDGGDGVFLATLVESFFTSSVTLLQALAAAIAPGDADALSRDAHRFKGEAATLGPTAWLHSARSSRDGLAARSSRRRRARRPVRERDALGTAGTASRAGLGPGVLATRAPSNFLSGFH